MYKVSADYIDHASKKQGSGLEEPAKGCKGDGFGDGKYKTTITWILNWISCWRELSGQYWRGCFRVDGGKEPSCGGYRPAGGATVNWFGFHHPRVLRRGGNSIRGQKSIRRERLQNYLLSLIGSSFPRRGSTRVPGQSHNAGCARAACRVSVSGIEGTPCFGARADCPVPLTGVAVQSHATSSPIHPASSRSYRGIRSNIAVLWKIPPSPPLKKKFKKGKKVKTVSDWQVGWIAKWQSICIPRVLWNRWLRAAPGVKVFFFCFLRRNTWWLKVRHRSRRLIVNSMLRRGANYPPSAKCQWISVALAVVFEDNEKRSWRSFFFCKLLIQWVFGRKTFSRLNNNVVNFILDWSISISFVRRSVIRKDEDVTVKGFDSAKVWIIG